MTNCTDLVVRGVPETAEDRKTTAGLVLAAVADHLTAVNPSVEMDPFTLPVCIGAEAYGLADRSLFGDAPAVSRAAMAEAPEVPEGITRGEFALHLRKAAAACGYDWTEDDNQPVIPSIPGPRREPAPKGGPGVMTHNTDTPTCCGKSMRFKGGQYVCRKCRGWFDPGQTHAVLSAGCVSVMRGGC